MAGLWAQRVISRAARAAVRQVWAACGRWDARRAGGRGHGGHRPAVAERVEPRQLLTASVTLSATTFVTTEGSPVVLDASYVNADSNQEPDGWSIDWGDGTIESGTGNFPNPLSHAYSDDTSGVYVAATFAAIDSCGPSVACASVIVDDAPPWVGAAAPTTAGKNTSVPLFVGYCDAGASDVMLGGQIDWGDGQQESFPSGVQSFSHAYASAGDYAIHVSVQNADGWWNAEPLPVAVAANPPQVSLGESLTLDEGSAVHLSPSVYDADGDAMTRFDIDWGDGQTEETFGNDPGDLAHTYTESGNYSATVTAYDVDNLSGSCAVSVFVNEVPMQMWASGDPSTFPGNAFNVQFGYSDPADRPTGWWIDWYDGSPTATFDATGSAATHSYADPGSHSYLVGMTDDDGQTYCTTLYVDVQSAPAPDPSAWLTGPGTVDEGSAVTLDPSFSDPAGGPASGWCIDWGDNTVEIYPGFAEHLSHAYDLPGSYCVTLYAANERASATTVAGLTVSDIQGQVQAGGPESVDEGSAYAISFGYENAAGDAPVESAFTVNWGDGHCEPYSAVDTGASHLYADDGEYSVTITTTDDDGQSAVAGLCAVVQEVAPFVAALGPGEAQEGYTYTLQAGYADPNDAVSGWTVYWGDGLSDAFGSDVTSFDHTYVEPGKYDVTLVAEDDDGQTFCAATTVAVANTLPQVYADGSTYVVEAGSAFTVTASFSDPAGELENWYVDWGDGTSNGMPDGPGDWYYSSGVTSFTHSYAVGHEYERAQYQIVVTAVAEDGLFSDAHMEVRVHDDPLPAPSCSSDSVWVSAPNSGTEWSAVDVTFGACAAGSEDGAHEFMIDWGDATSDTVGLSDITQEHAGGTHVYKEEGLYPITVTADNGGVARDWVRVEDAQAVIDTDGSSVGVDDDKAYASFPFSADDIEDVFAAFVDWADGYGPQEAELRGNLIVSEVPADRPQGGVGHVTLYDTDGRKAEANFTPPGQVDLDIDSDNDNDKNRPDLSNAEDRIEDDDAKLGKLVAVNDGDLDHDRVRDYADFDGTQGASFVPVIISLRPGIDLTQAKIKIAYAGAAPGDVRTSGAGTATDPKKYELGDGRTRLWLSDAEVARNATKYVVPDQAYTPAQLQVQPNGEIKLFLEAVRPSETIAAEHITVSVDPDGDANGESYDIKDAVRATYFTTTMVRVGETSGPQSEAVERADLSTPEPAFAGTSIEVTNLQYFDNYTRIQGDIKVSATIDDALSDLIPGTEGTIGSLGLFLNGGSERVATIPLTVDKEHFRSSSHLHPFDYSGAVANFVVSGVELQPGWNTLELLAANAAGGTGLASRSVNVAVAPRDKPIQLRLTPVGTTDPFTVPGGQVELKVWEDGHADAPEVEDTFDQVGTFGSGPITFTGPSGTFEAVVGPAPAGGGPEEVSVTLQLLRGDPDLSRRAFSIPKTSSQGTRFEGVATIPGAERDTALWTDYINYGPPTIADGSAVVASDGMQLNVYAFRVDAPANFKDFVSQLAVGEKNFTRDLVEYGGKLYVGAPYDELDPYGLRGSIDRTLLAKVVQASTDSPATIKVPVEVPGTFTDGLLEGLGAPFVEMYETAVGIKDTAAKAWDFIVENPQYVLDPKLVVTELGYKAGVTLYNNRDAIVATVKRSVTLGHQAVTAAEEVLKQIANDPAAAADVIGSLIDGTHPVYATLPHELQVALETGAELIESLATSIREEIDARIKNFTEYDTGWYMGYALTTIAIEAALAAATAGAANVATMALKSQALGRVALKFERFGGYFAKAARRIVGFTTEMCFAAGTPVHTAAGMVPIERIRAGDLVLSRDERTGEQAYKSVVETLVTRPDALYTVTYDRDGDGPIPAEHVVTTAPHPFYVSNRDGDGDGHVGGFVPADALVAGDALALADGGSAGVVGVTIERAGAADAFTTYNFAVADFHTYFVNADGVWVHNASSRFCDRAYSAMQFVRKRLTKNKLPPGASAVDAQKSLYLTAADWAAKHVPNLTKQNVAHLYAETFDDIYREGTKGWLSYYEGKPLPPRPNGQLWSAPHTTGKHVGQLDAQLRSRFADPTFAGDVASTFPDQGTAEDAVSFFLTAEREKIIAKATNAKAGTNFSKLMDLGRPIGHGIDRAGNKLTGLHRVNLNIVFDGRGGWFVHTAYPTP